MQTLPYFQVNAFTNSVYGGNPAGVCPLTKWLPTDVMQDLAAENNLSETAFFVPEGDEIHIRWFTPEIEMDLAGHPTLATAYVIFNHLGYTSDSITFTCKSGLLHVVKKGNLLEMNFPSRIPETTNVPIALREGINGHQPTQILKSRDWVLIYENEEEVANFTPNFDWLNRLEDTVGIIVTAPGNEYDFVSRFFVPNSVISEDAVTGSAHATLIPYWAGILGKKQLTAKQISKRGGILYCINNNDRVTIAGECVLYLKGEYYLYE